MENIRIHALTTKILNTLISLNPELMNNIFTQSTYTSYNKCNLEVAYRNAFKYGEKSLRSHGANIWNSVTKISNLI